MLTRALILLSFFAVACDADDDGLSSIQEGKYGTDAKLADSDGDGLLDGDEVNIHFTDPAVFDSDGDGYPDGFEIEMGSDANDDKSLAYKGGWPFNPSSDDLEASARSGRNAAINKTWPRMVMQDQFGDFVDIYDFANQGKPIVIDISAEWCGPCRAMAEWIEGDTVDANFPTVPEKVANGEVIWLTILGENNAGEAATKKTAKDWYDDFPNPHVPVLADKARVSVDYADLAFWPTTFFLNEKMRILENDTTSVLQAVEDL